MRATWTGAGYFDEVAVSELKCRKRSAVELDTEEYF